MAKWDIPDQYKPVDSFTRTNANALIEKLKAATADGAISVPEANELEKAFAKYTASLDISNNPSLAAETSPYFSPGPVPYFSQSISLAGFNMSSAGSNEVPRMVRPGFEQNTLDRSADALPSSTYPYDTPLQAAILDAYETDSVPDNLFEIVQHYLKLGKDRDRHKDTAPRIRRGFRGRTIGNWADGTARTICTKRPLSPRWWPKSSKPARIFRPRWDMIRNTRCTSAQCGPSSIRRAVPTACISTLAVYGAAFIMWPHPRTRV